MRICLRTSGGRGEYELSGSHGGIDHWKFLGKPLTFVFANGITLPGHVALTKQGGKPRLRLDQSQKGAQHLYKLVAGLLLMPLPQRELNKTTASVDFWEGGYSITSFGVKILSVSSAKFYVEDLTIGSSNGLHARLDIAERLATVQSLWDWASHTPNSPLANALLQHRHAVTIASSNHRSILEHGAAVLAFASKVEDPIFSLCNLAGILPFSFPEAEHLEFYLPTIEEEDSESPLLSRTRLIRKSRMILDRGPEGAKFRKQVREAYADRCLASGKRLPGSPGGWKAGVEAAHIFPFAFGGINSVPNGLLLCPDAHWAFDQGFLRLSYHAAKKRYTWSWNRKLFDMATGAGCELAKCDFALGEIDPTWLPSNRIQHPDIAALNSLDQLFAGK